MFVGWLLNVSVIFVGLLVGCLPNVSVIFVGWLLNVSVIFVSWLVA